MDPENPDRRAARRQAFTLIELLTVSFIIAMMVAIILPALQAYRRKAAVERTRHYMMTLKHALDSYKQDLGQYPPSEPDRVNWNDQNVKVFNGTSTSNGPPPGAWRLCDVPYYSPSSDLLGFYGPAALVLYLNGRRSQNTNMNDLGGYSVTADTTGNRPDISETSQYYSPSNVGGLAGTTQTWPARVTGIAISPRFQYAPRCGYVFSSGWRPGTTQFGAQSAGFLDAWGNEIEYFLAYRNRGSRTIDIFPRAVNLDYNYVFSQANPGVQIPPPDDLNLAARTVAGYGIHVPAIQWMNESYKDYRAGWQSQSVPINVGSYLLVSPGPDGVFGTPDDIGNW